MPKRALLLLTLLLLLACAPGFASEVMQSTLATEYGAWSNWREEPIEPGPSTEVEQAVRAVGEEKLTWRYTRYEYFNEIRGGLYASPAEQAGEHVRPGSGRWALNEVDAPLDVVGQEEGYTMYAGGWFNEEAVRTPEVRSAVMYRSRTVKRITCEVSTDELLIFPDNTRQLRVNLFDGSESYRWESSDPGVATVDGSGNVTGRAVGAARVYVRSSKGREVSIDVYVCEKTATIPKGLYTLRLVKTDKALTVGGSLASKSDNLIVSNYTGERKQRFVVNNVSGKTFTMHPIDHRKWSVDIARNKKNKIQAGSNIRTHAKRDRAVQYFRAVYVPDGSYILYPKANPELIVGVEPVSRSGNVRLDPNGDMETLDRWVFIEADESIDPVSPFARPVARDGVSYVSSEFNAQDDRMGITFGSNGRRVFVLAAARGTVVEVSSDCAHDEPKQPGASGEPADPCSLDGKSLGNYVVIDHGGGVTAVYAHLSKIFVKEGDSVRQGGMIGRSGASGSAAEVSLYFEMRLDGTLIDPRSYIKLPDLNKPIE